MSTEIGKEEVFLNSFRSWQPITCSPVNLAFTVMSYNVLSQALLERSNKLNKLYEKNNQIDLEWDNRKKALLIELKYHNADILCLQEVESTHLQFYFDELKKLGYDGIFKQRTGNWLDGSAVFYKTEKFSVISHFELEYFRDGVNVLDGHNEGIIVKMKYNNTEFVVVSTHLLYDPQREYARVAQIQLLLAELHNIASINGTDKYLPIILTGDFNLEPDTPGYKLLVTGNLDYKDYKDKLLPRQLNVTDHCQYSKMDAVEPFGTGVLDHKLNFKSAFDYTAKDKATTYQHKWINLDYIFYGEKLKLCSAYSVPSPEECDKLPTIPNWVIGSDHLAVLAKFMFE